MSTHRSLNKLEFKAHMSIHNIKDVEEDETHGSGLTRDRFGKRHRLSDKDGTLRIRRRKLKLGAGALTLLGALAYGRAAADTEPPTYRNTDIQVETGGLDADSWLNQKLNQPQERFRLPMDDSTALEIDDNGDPNLNMQF